MLNLDEMNRVTLRAVMPSTVDQVCRWMGIPIPESWRVEKLSDEELGLLAERLGDALYHTFEGEKD